MKSWGETESGDPLSVKSRQEEGVRKEIKNVWERNPQQKQSVALTAEKYS